MSSERWKVGDRVVRPEKVYKPDSPLMHGTVIRVNPDNSVAGLMGLLPREVVDVQWDPPFSFTGHGYLPHGLRPEVQLDG